MEPPEPREEPPDDLTALIAAWEPRRGVPVDALWQVAYQELKALAHASLRGRGELTLLPTTALVNEAYLKLVALGRLRVEGRRQFFAYCAKVMRSVVLDLVREKHAERRGNAALHVAWSPELEASVAGPAAVDEPLQVDLALKSLETYEPRLAQVVEMRYFAGFTEPEIAEILGITERTVRRDWQKARLLLRALLS